MRPAGVDGAEMRASAAPRTIGVSSGMTKSWLLKSEPSTYSWADLVRDGRTVWDGISAPAALMHLRAMKTGDEALIYHSGNDKAIVGIARISRGPYPDPKLDDPKRVVVEVEAVRPLKAPVSLAVIKAAKNLAKLPLVRISRLSTMPVSVDERAELKKLGVR
jgi:predicted RNA-binding protein with PUA-like domain